MQRILQITGFVLFMGFISSSEGSDVSYQDLNNLLGIDLFADPSLWDDAGDDVADRLQLDLEGKTSILSSYRSFSTGETKVLGSSTYTTALYCREDQPHRISIMFLNKGDYPPFAAAIAYPSEEDIEAFEEKLENEEEKLVSKLSNLLGEAERGRMGKGKILREKLLRWDWNEHAILLSVQDGEYIALRITTPEFADNKGVTESASNSEMRALLSERVVRRENGDVIITDIPMADQGPKGYCAPATWERYLRYMNIPADMYILARAGSTDYGGGTNPFSIAPAVDDLARDFDRKLDEVKYHLRIKKLARYIDDGLPLMWGVFADSYLYKNGISSRTQKRSEVTDWSEWKEYLDQAREAVEEMDSLKMGGHVCMIIGYNEETQEIATSDSWGPGFEERWMTIEEAEAMSMGILQSLRW